MQKIVWEQTERRKSELEVLQSQINPHFLYNTLDSITWMIEGERNDDAVFMISQLARLFRISLSKGHTIISIRDELQHAQSYMNIQKVRYKNKFQITFDVDSDILDCCIVKLILQPILENAINYGVREMDDCGEIIVQGRKEEDEILFTIADNGMGIPEEEIEFLLTDTQRVHKKGSGVGLVNVNNRIKILFGEKYGLHIESELDEGTTVSIRIPAIIYSEENRKKFENTSKSS
jgi:two-component system sensor histidine kinase YesM